MNTIVRRVCAITASAALALGVGVALAPASQAAVNNDTITQAWFRYFFGLYGEEGRADADRARYVARLDAGEKASDVLWSLTHSRRYVEQEITGYYNDHLGRAPDSGASYWVDGALNRGMALEWVEQNILASNEYFEDHFGNSLGASATVKYWYSDILGRYNAGDGEANYWAARQRQVGRLQVVREIWYSDEAVRYRIDDNYSDVLGRDADFAGLSYWYGKEVESDINVAVLLGTTQEFYSRRVY